MKKLLSVLISLMIIMTFIACDNNSTDGEGINNAVFLSDCFEINSESDYFTFVKMVEMGADTEGIRVVLLNDLTFKGNFKPISEFKGTFDGNQKTIDYSISSYNGEYFGLIALTEGEVEIKDLNLVVNVDLSTSENVKAVGAVVGMNNAEILTLDGVVVSGNIKVKIEAKKGYYCGIEGDGEIDNNVIDNPALTFDLVGTIPGSQYTPEEEIPAETEVPSED